MLTPSTGMFSWAWGQLASDLGAEVEEMEGDWRSAFDADRIEQRLREDSQHRIKAVLAVQTDTATSVTSDIAAVRRALDACGHPALLMADVVASLGTVDFRMDDWGVDVAIAGSQKGLMTPPGLAFTAVSPRALEQSRTAGIRRGYWDWERRMDSEEFYMKFFGTPPEHLMWGLREALDMLFEEGLDTAFARHRRLATAVHAAVEVWGQTGALELNALNPSERAASVTTIRVANGIDSNRLRLLARDELDVSLGYGLGPLDGKAFRIGHMGWINEPMVLGALGAVEMAMQACSVPYRKGGVTAASIPWPRPGFRRQGARTRPDRQSRHSPARNRPATSSGASAKARNDLHTNRELRMARMTTARAIVRSLVANGVDTVFGLPGVQLDALFNALHDERNRIRVVHPRHEQAAAYMALGYAQASATIGAYVVVPGPGILNTTAALATAYGTCSPVLAITGQLPSHAIGEGYGLLHEIPDQLAILRGLTKWAARIEHPTHAAAMMHAAFDKLRSGVPRPVAIESPMDVLGLGGEHRRHRGSSRQGAESLPTRKPLMRQPGSCPRPSIRSLWSAAAHCMRTMRCAKWRRRCRPR